ncbi:ENTH domain-containing protein 1 [Callospermophilus lateralis]|uniref:ENTH domain-containing protein 1 n=1 Tax=Callospermophilus lateralis TaxID=76772 RepID=UPI00405454B0
MAFRRQMKNFMKNYSDAEIKVREATSNDPWGPSSSLMLDISDLTFNTISLSEIMNMLWQRLSDHGKNWRHVYKSLTLMDYLIKNGSKKVIHHCREGFCNLHMLKDFQHIDEAGKDQGYHIREKSKQVITLLMDEQMLYKEREVACRTRRRTSYSMTFPKRLPSTGNSPTACASAPTPEIPASEKKHQLLKVARLRSKRKVKKAGLKQELHQHMQSPAGTVLSQEILPLRINSWKSTEDLMQFYDEDPKPTLPPSIISSSRWLSEGQAEVCSLWDADAVPTPSDKSPSLQTNVSLDKKSENTITDTVAKNPLQTLQKRQAASESFETLTTLPAFWSSSKEEFISSDLRISQSDSTSYNQSSIETLYVSPSFETCNSTKGTVINKDLQKPVQASAVQMHDADLKAPATWVPTTSEGTSSFSTLSVSSPDLNSPEKSVHHFPPTLPGSSLWTLSHQQSLSASLQHKDKTAKAQQHFAPSGPLFSDEEENDSFNLLELLPDNSDSAKKTSHISRSNWVELSAQNVDHSCSIPCSSFQPTKGLPREPEAKSSIKVLLGDVKSAVVRLHEDLSTVIQELNVISSHLISMSGSSLQTSKSLQDPQSSEGSSDQI